MTEWIQILCAFCGSLGFAFLYNQKGFDLVISAIGGMSTWGIYLLFENITANIFLLNIIAAAFAAAFAEVLARLRKVPATFFTVPAIIPLAPGGSLYYTLLYIIRKDSALAEQYGLNTLLAAGGIAVGIVLVSLVTGRANRNKK